MPKLIPEKRRKFVDECLDDDNYSALALYELVDRIMPGSKHNIDSWEPETIWLELENQGLSISEININKLLCCISMRVINPVYTDVVAFKNSCLAINNELPMTDCEEEVEAEQIAWFIVFMRRSMRRDSFFLDHGPLEFIAKTLHNEGFVLAPTPLAFSQERLSYLNENNDLEKDVKKAIKDKSKGNPIIDVQIEKMNQVAEYIVGMYKQTDIDLYQQDMKFKE